MSAILKLKYYHAGTRNLFVTLLAVAYVGIYRQTCDLSWVYDNFIPLLSASVLFSFALSAVLYMAALRRGALCAKGGCTGRPGFGHHHPQHLLADHIHSIGRAEMQSPVGSLTAVTLR